IEQLKLQIERLKFGRSPEQLDEKIGQLEFVLEELGSQETVLPMAVRADAYCTLCSYALSGTAGTIWNGSSLAWSHRSAHPTTAVRRLVRFSLAALSVSCARWNRPAEEPGPS